MKKIFPGQVGEDGTFKDTGLGRYLSMFEDFSIAEKIDNLIGFIFDVPRKAIEWVKTLFSDPKEALTQLWTRFLPTLGEGIGGLMDIMFLPVRLAIDWVSRKFGFRDEDAPVFSFKTFIRESFDKVTEWLKTMPKKLGLAIEEWFAGVQLSMAVNFAMIKESILDALRYATLKARLIWNFGENDRKIREEMKSIFGAENLNEATVKSLQEAQEQFLAATTSINAREKAMNVVGGDTTNTTNINLSGSPHIIVKDN
jgi:hypothetical protein